MSARDPEDIEALRAASDVLGIDALLSDEERAVRDRVRAFVDAEIRPHIADWFDRAVLPRRAGPGARRARRARHEPRRLRMPRAQRRGVRARRARARGRATPACARSSRCRARSRWARSTAGAARSRSRSGCRGWRAGEVIGCFGLTEPGAGSDPSSMKTFARRDGDDWVLTGSKRWIGLASVAQLAVVWAQTDDGVRGFIVPTDAAGLPRDGARAEALDARVDPVRARTSTTCGCRPPRSFPAPAVCAGRSLRSTRRGTGSCGARSAPAATATRRPCGTRCAASSSTGRSRGSS